MPLNALFGILASLASKNILHYYADLKTAGAKKIKKLYLFILAIFLFTSSACAGEASGIEPAATMQSAFSDFREIPGVTAEEIAAIEEMQTPGKTFTYGALNSTEYFVGEDGEMRGFTVHFCEYLTLLFGIRFEPKLVEWNELTEGLENDEIDFTGELTATPERLLTYMMTDAIAGRSVSYMRLVGSAPLSHLSVSRPLRFAFLEGTTTIDDVAVHYSGDYEAFIVGSYEDAHTLLVEGAVDAFIDEDTGEAAFDIFGDVISEPFYPLIHGPVSLATHNGDNEPIITVVQKALEHEHIRRFLTDIYNTGLREYKSHKMFAGFTQQEIDYINSRPQIMYAAEFDNYPVSFYNTREGQWQGVFFDVLTEVENLTGLTFTRINEEREEFSVLLGMLEDGEVSFISEVIKTPEREGSVLWPDTPLLTDNYALLSKEEFPSIMINEVWHSHVGVVEDTAYAETFTRWFPNHLNVTTFANFEQAYEALTQGIVDLVMTSRNQLLLLTNFRELTGYKANIVFDYTLESYIGFNNSEEILHGIFEKAMRQIDVNKIERLWVDKTYDYTLKVAEERLPWFIGTIVLLLSVIVLLIVYFLARSRTELLAAENAMLSELNRKKIEFLQDMQHEVRSPLTVIATGVDVTDHLFGKISTETNVAELRKARSTLDTVRDETQRLGRMISGMLTVASMSEVGENRKRVDVNALLRSVCNTFKEEATGNKIIAEIAPDLPDVFVEHDRMKQVVVNLLSNADAHTKNGKITVAATQNGQFIIVTVSDTGYGISPEMLERVFERGVSGRGSTGYGLYISKAVVEAHGGEIGIESVEGSGTKVTFTIPVYGGQDAGRG